MERRPDGIYTTKFEKLLPDMASLVEDHPFEVFTIKIERFGGELFGNINFSGEKIGKMFKIQVDDVLPLVLGNFFLAIAQENGEVHPGGIYIINYFPEEDCKGDTFREGTRRGAFDY